MKAPNFIHHSVKKSMHVYRRFEKYAPIVAFISGFTWDSLTLTRIDRLMDNVILLTYLLALGVFITLLHYSEQGRITQPILVKHQKWIPVAIQFLMGGLLSSYVVFYIQSASFSQTWIFVSLLASLLVANEFLEKRVSNIYLLFGLYFFAAYSFFIFFIPVIFKIMNTWIFLLSGIFSLLFISGMLFLFYKKKLVQSDKQLKELGGIVSGIYLLILLFYWANLIPPVPLSLKTGGVFHHVSRTEQGYLLKYAQPSWYQPFKDSDNPVYYQKGDTTFCFTAVFAPTMMKKKIYHHWHWYNPKKEEWVQTDKLGFKITGGREGGFRGYTYKRHVQPGEWKIDVKTEEGLVLGKLSFVILNSSPPDSVWVERVY